MRATVIAVAGNNYKFKKNNDFNINNLNNNFSKSK